MVQQNNNDHQFWIALHQIKGLGSAKLCKLLSQFGTPEDVFNASLSTLQSVVEPNIAERIYQGVDETAIQATLVWLEDNNNHLITLADETYPKQLLEISNPPAILYAKGNLEALKQPAIAIVGSRNATPQGIKNAQDFAENLANQRLCIISGMALGIDGAAHQGALKAPKTTAGATIAVVGTGLDIVYPARHRQLAHEIADNGLLLSEFPIGTPSKPQNFPRRNRIITGLSLGCLVVEANVGSGSLISAKLAAEQGREVFAIPGSIHSPVAKGCHALIKQGAKLVESSDDILSEIQFEKSQKTLKTISPNGSLPERANTPPEASTVLDSMGFEPIAFDKILPLTGLTSNELSTMLTILELEGKIASVPGGQYQRLA